MAEASWNKNVIARSDSTVEVEGNQYFPPDDVDMAYLVSSDTTSSCPWKGTAQYYHVEANGQRLDDAAWFYPAPKQAADNIRGHIAFWKGVEVSKA